MKFQFVFFVLGAVLATAETPKQAKTGGVVTSLPIPVVNVRTRSEVKLPPSARAGGVTLPLHCSTDGTLYAEAIGGEESVVTAINPEDGTVTLFDARKVTDLTHPDVRNFFFSGNELYLLLLSTTDIHEQKVTITNPAGEPTGTRSVKIGTEHYYIARFKRDGSYEGLVELELPFDPMQFAVFENGDFVVSGFDRATRSFLTALVQSNGQLSRYLMKDERAKPADHAAGRTVSSLASPVILIENGDTILGFGGGVTGNRVVRISTGGKVDKVTIQTPNKGDSVLSLMSTTRGWIVSFTKPTERIDTVETFLVNPSTGKLILQYKFENAAAGLGMCGGNDEFHILKYDQEQKVMVVEKAAPAQ